MSKIVSGSRLLQAPRLKKTTVFGSRIDGRTHRFSRGEVTGGPPPIVPPADTTFYAPLTSNLTDYVNGAPATFTRSTVGWYEDSGGVWRQAAVNQPRFQNGGLLIENGSTNLCTNYNAAAGTSLAGVNGNGATVAAVLASADLVAAGLGVIVSDGFVFELDNQTGGTTTSTIATSGFTAGIHTLSAWINTFGNTITFGMPGDGDLQQIVNTNALTRIVGLGNPTDTNQNIEVILSPGQKCQFILNQFTRNFSWESPILVAGATATRGTDKVVWDVSANPVYNASEGMCGIYLYNRFGQFSVQLGGSVVRSPIVAVEEANAVKCLIGMRNGSGVNTLYSYIWDDASELQFLTNEFPTADKIIKTSSRWGPSDVRKQGTQTKNDDSWFTTPAGTKGDWTSENIVVIGKNTQYSQIVSEVRIWNVDNGIAWLQANL